jgi:hypothetical protein
MLKVIDVSKSIVLEWKKTSFNFEENVGTKQDFYALLDILKLELQLDNSDWCLMLLICQYPVVLRWTIQAAVACGFFISFGQNIRMVPLNSQ